MWQRLFISGRQEVERKGEKDPDQDTAPRTLLVTFLQLLPYLLKFADPPKIVPPTGIPSIHEPLRGHFIAKV
jgi:hypothetical protein